MHALKNFLLAAAFSIGAAVSGAASADFDLFNRQPTATVTSGQDSADINAAQAEAYNGPKARIAVSRFTDKTRKSQWWTREIGDGMADQLVTALFNSNRYIVLERQTLGDVLGEQDLGASGRIRQDTAAPIGLIEGAELMITGAVTEFEDNAGGTKGGGGGLLGSVLGAVTGGIQKAHMAIDIRVIDTRTSRILAATSVEGESSDVNLGGALGGYFGHGNALGGALSSWKNTPKEKALRIVINKAVDFIVSKTPPVYYRHGAGASTPSSRPSTSSGGASKSAAPAPASAATGGGMEARLKRLKKLHEQGLINDSEYAAKRDQILNEL